MKTMVKVMHGKRHEFDIHVAYLLFIASLKNVEAGMILSRGDEMRCGSIGAAQAVLMSPVLEGPAPVHVHVMV
jgi:hypothetical protein